MEFSVLSSGGDVLSVGTDGNSVNVAFVSLELVSDGEVGVIDLEPSIPANSDEVGLEVDLGGLGDRWESDHADPISVVILLSGELAISEGIEQLDFSFSTWGDNLSVVRTEGNGENFLSVSYESLFANSVLQIP